MDSAKLVALLRGCISSKYLKPGLLIHQKVITLGLESNITICKTLIKFYFSCQIFESARLVFQSIQKPIDISLWNGLIAGYTNNFMYTEALEFFERLLHFPGLQPDSYTYPSVSKACGGLGRPNYGQVVHSHVIKSGALTDVVVSSSILGMYAKCGLFDSARQLFDEMPERDVACWNNVISCYYQNGQCEEALELFEKMKASGFHPDSVTITTALSSCARLLDLEKGKEIHNELVTYGFTLDGFISAALVDMYGKCGCLEMAVEVFEAIPLKSLVAWNSIIAAYSLIGDSFSCIELFRRMKEEGVKPTSTTVSCLLMACSRSVNLQLGKFVHGYIIRNYVEADIFVNSSLLDLYLKCGSVVSAESIFAKMSRTNVVAWNVMISGYVSAGSYFKAFCTFNDMEEAGIKPNAITFTTILMACSQLAALERGRGFHKRVVENKLESDEIVMGAVLDMYAKCGAVEEALSVFNRLPERDLVAWTSMIMAYGTHGQAFEALYLFREMEKSNVKPDRVTFLAVISACSHAGLVEEGCYYFNLMINNYDIKPTVEDYSCLVDLLGRTGRLHDAYWILQNTPSIKDDVGLLSTLFSACHLNGELELGEKIGRTLIKEAPVDHSTYIMLAKMYASDKRWDEARKVRIKMRELGLKKNPGCSWIEVDKRIQTFFTEDKSYPEAGQVFDCLACLAIHMEMDELEL